MLAGATHTPKRPGQRIIASMSRAAKASASGSGMAEVAVPKRLFAAILERIRRLRMPETVPR